MYKILKMDKNDEVQVHKLLFFIKKSVALKL